MILSNMRGSLSWLQLVAQLSRFPHSRGEKPQLAACWVSFGCSEPSSTCSALGQHQARLQWAQKRDANMARTRGSVASRTRRLRSLLWIMSSGTGLLRNLRRVWLRGREHRVIYVGVWPRGARTLCNLRRFVASGTQTLLTLQRILLICYTR